MSATVNRRCEWVGARLVLACFIAVPGLASKVCAIPSAEFPMVQPTTDEELLTRLRARDPIAFTEFVRDNGGRMRSVARRLLRNDADADEVVQDAFLALVRGLDDFRGDAAVSSWLHRIVINGALVRLRSRNRQEEELPEELLPQFVGPGVFAVTQEQWPASPLSEAILAELRVEVRAGIDRLPETIRTAVILRDIEGLSNDEIAADLGVTVTAVKLRVHRGRQALRSSLEKRLGKAAL